MPRHGEKRNIRTITSHGKKVEFVGPDGDVVYSGPCSSSSRPAYERWCEKCQEWQDVGKSGLSSWILGSMICPVCHGDW